MISSAGRRALAPLSAGRGNALGRGGRPRPEHYSPRYPSRLINAATSTTGWAVASGCTVTTASVTNPEGVAQTLVKITGTADNTSAFWDCTTAPLNGAQLGKDGLEFDFYYQSGEPYSELGSTGSALTLTFTDLTNSVSVVTQIRQGWQRIRVRKADFAAVVAAGNWDTTVFTRLRFKIQSKASVTHVAHIRNLSYMGRNDKVKICIQFDDIIESVITNAYPLMLARGIPGSCAVISDGIGLDAYAGFNRLTVAEMLTMKANGWDFVNHTKSHQTGVLPTATQAACATEIETCRDAIISNGIGNGISEHCFCSPYGEYGTNYWAAAAAAGCKLFRGTVGDAGNIPRVADADVMLSPLVQVGTHYVVRTSTAASLLADVDSAIGRGGYQIYLFHAIEDGVDTDIKYSIANFTTFLDGLVTRRANLEFVNMSQLYEACRQ